MKSLILNCVAVSALLVGCKTNNIDLAPEAGAGDEPSTDDMPETMSEAGGASGMDREVDTEMDLEPVAACESASDCEAVPCQEAPTCEDGICQAGDSSCGVFDADNCACVSGDGGDCSVKALDADSDGHGSARCEVDPGDDCDDTNETVYAGAEELCDGLDNDCDGLQDLDEGLAPHATFVPVSGSAFGPNIRMAWSTAAQGYGIARMGDVNTPGGYKLDMHFGMVDPAGTYTETLPSVIELDLGSIVAAETALTYGYEEFAAVLLEAAGDGSKKIVVRRIGATGTSTVGGELEFAVDAATLTDLRVLRPTKDDWVVLWYQGLQTHATRIHQGQLVPEETDIVLADTMTGWGAAAGAPAYWTERNTEGADITYWSDVSSGLLSPSASGEIGELLLNPLFGTDLAGETLAYVDKDTVAETLTFNSLTSDSAKCENVALPYRNIPQNGLHQVGENWVLVRSTGSPYYTTTLNFSQVFSDCSASVGIADFQVPVPLAKAFSVAAGGEQGLAVAWKNAEDDDLQVALFGPHICESP